MIKSLHRFLSLTGVLVTVTFNYCYSQDITHHAAVDSYLSGLFDQSILSNTPTGFLIDRAFEVTNVRNFNGSALTDSNYVDVNAIRINTLPMHVWENLLEHQKQETEYERVTFYGTLVDDCCRGSAAGRVQQARRNHLPLYRQQP